MVQIQLCCLWCSGTISSSELRYLWVSFKPSLPPFNTDTCVCVRASVCVCVSVCVRVSVDAENHTFRLGRVKVAVVVNYYQIFNSAAKK